MTLLAWWHAGSFTFLVFIRVWRLSGVETKADSIISLHLLSECKSNTLLKRDLHSRMNAGHAGCLSQCFKFEALRYDNYLENVQKITGLVRLVNRCEWSGKMRWFMGNIVSQSTVMNDTQRFKTKDEGRTDWGDSGKQRAVVQILIEKGHYLINWNESIGKDCHLVNQSDGIVSLNEWERKN